MNYIHKTIHDLRWCFCTGIEEFRACIDEINLWYVKLNSYDKKIFLF